MPGLNRSGLCLAVTVLLFGGCKVSNGAGNEREVIRITASKFQYSPSHIELRTGVPVILELISRDRVHGFHVPELGIRADVLPDQPVRVTLQPGKAGRYAFLCDIFCGSGHDEMSGVIIVSD